MKNKLRARNLAQSLIFLWKSGFLIVFLGAKDYLSQWVTALKHLQWAPWIGRIQNKVSGFLYPPKHIDLPSSLCYNSIKRNRMGDYPRLRELGLAILMILSSAYSPLYSLPEGENVVEGSVTFDRSQASTLKINVASDKAIISYNSFSIAANENVYFNQPSISSAALNRITGSEASGISGLLSANGVIYLVNPNGINISSAANINAAGLIASTLNISNADFLAGRNNFFKDGVNAFILNQGNIVIRNGGFVALLSQAVENQGVIIANLGSVVVASGEKMTLALDDLSQISVVIDEGVKEAVFGADGKKITSAVKNSGTITANGGKVLLTAKSLHNVFDYAVNNTGIVEAKSLESRNGIIELKGDGAPIVNSGTLKAGQIKVNATSTEFINKGKVIAEIDNTASASGNITIQVSTLLQGGLILAGKLVTIDAQDIGFVLDYTPMAMEIDQVLNTSPTLLIQAPEVRVTAKQFGSSNAPLNIDAALTYINRAQGDINILDSLGIGTSVLLRGPPDGFGAIVYNRNTNLTLQTQQGNIGVYADFLANGFSLIASRNVDIYANISALVGSINVESTNKGDINLYGTASAPNGVVRLWTCGNMDLRKAVIVSREGGYVYNPDDDILVSWIGGTNNSWGTAANWSGGAVPNTANYNVTIDMADAAVTTGTAYTIGTVTIGTTNLSGLTLGASMTIDDSLGSSGNVTIGPNGTFNIGPRTLSIDGNWSNSGTLNVTTGTVAFTKPSGTQTLDSGGAGASNSFNNINHSGAGVLQLVNNNLNVNGDFDNSNGTIDINDKNISVSGRVTLDSGTITGTTGILTSNANYAVQSGTISAILGGAVGLTKTTAGTIILSGANTYTGVTTISNGALRIQNDSALGTTAGATTIASGAVLEIDGSSLSIAEPLNTLKGTGISAGGALRNISGNNTWSGNITLGANSRINSDSGTLTISGGISGAFDLTVGGAGNTTISGAIGTGANPLTKDGAGTFTLSGANTYTGLTTISAGTLQYGASNVISTGNITVSGGTLDIVSYSDTVGTVTLADGTITGTTGVLTSNANYAVQSGTISAILGGAVGLTKTTTGTVTITSANQFTGAVSINAGVLNIQNNFALGTNAGGVSLTAGEVLELQGGITVADEAITLRGTGASAGGALRNISGNNTWTGAITLGAASRINSDSGTFTISGGISGAFNLTVGGAGNTTISGIIGTGTGTFTKDGNGTLVLSGANTYTGLTTISAGTLQYGASNVISTGNITVSGGTLDIVSYSDTVGTVTLDSGTITGTTGVLTSNANYAVQSGTISAILGGAVGLTKTTAGTVILSGANTYTGVTTINVGTLSYGANDVISNTGAVTVSGGTLDIVSYSDTVGTVSLDSGGIITGTTGVLTGSSYAVQNGTISAILGGSGALTKTGTGTVTLSGANTYSGGTTLNTGTLNINNAIALGTGTFTISGGTINNTSGSAITLSNNNAQSWNANFTFTGSNDLNLGIGAITLGANSAVTVSASVLTVGGIIGGNYTLTKQGDGTLVLSGANTYTGLTTISAGTLQYGANNVIATGGITVSGGTLDLASYLDTVGTVILSNGGTITDSVGGGTLASTTTYDVRSGTISVKLGGTIGLAKTTTGTVVLSGVNTYTGATTIDAGILSITADSGLGTAPGSATTNHLVFSGGTLQTTANFTLNSNRGIALNTGGGTIEVASGTTLAYGGIIAGSTALTKDGAGTLALSGTNTYTGATTVNAGILNVQSNSALGTTAGATSVASGAAIQIDGSGLNIAEPLSSLIGTGVLSAGALRNLANDNTWSGAITLGTGGATINSDNGTLTISGGITGTAKPLTVGGAGSVTISGVIGTTTGTLTKTGTGTLTLSGANTYTGVTTINAGTLLIGTDAPSGSAGALGNATSAVLLGDTSGSSDAALLTNGAFTVGRAITVQSGSSGTATIGGNSAHNSTFSGNITLNKAMRFSAANGGTVIISGTISNAFLVTKIGEGTLQRSTNPLNLSGAFTISAGTFNANGQAVTVTGLTTVNGGTYQTDSGAQTLTGGLIFSSGTITQGTGDIILRGNMTVSSGVTFTRKPSGKIIFASGTGTQQLTSNGINIGNIQISANTTNTTLTLQDALNIDNITIDANQTLDANNFDINVGGGWTNNGGAFTAGSGRATFNGVVAQVIGGSVTTTFNNLNLNNANGLTLNNGLTINGILTLTSGTLAVGAHTLTLNGPAIAGTPGNLSTTSSSSLVFGGSSTGINIPSSVTVLNNLTISNANGVTLNTSPTISGTLILTNGAKFKLTVSAATDTKTYDGTTASTGTSVISSGNLLAGDSDAWTQSFDSKNVGTGKTITPAGTVSDGNGGNNYSITFINNTTGVINVKALAVTGITAGDKVYDGSTTATLNTVSASLSGVVGLDAVALSIAGIAGAFNDKNAGINKAVAISGLAISGADSANYSLTQPAATADITAKSLTVSVTAVNKVYDDNTTATVILSDDRIASDVLTHTYASATFVDKSVATGKAVNVSGITLSGIDAGNYTFNTTASTTADIIPGSASNLVFVQQLTNANAGENIVSSPIVELRDAWGNICTNDSVTNVTLSIGNNPAGGILSGAVTRAVSSGSATFDKLFINKAGMGYVLSAQSQGLTSVASNAFNITSTDSDSQSSNALNPSQPAPDLGQLGGIPISTFNTGPVFLYTPLTPAETGAFAAISGIGMPTDGGVPLPTSGAGALTDSGDLNTSEKSAD